MLIHDYGNWTEVFIWLQALHLDTYWVPNHAHFKKYERLAIQNGWHAFRLVHRQNGKGIKSQQWKNSDIKHEAS